MCGVCVCVYVLRAILMSHFYFWHENEVFIAVCAQQRIIEYIAIEYSDTDSKVFYLEH